MLWEYLSVIGVGGRHYLHMNVGNQRVSGIADQADSIPRSDRFAFGYRYRTVAQVSEQYKTARYVEEDMVSRHGIEILPGPERPQEQNQWNIPNVVNGGPIRFLGMN